MNDEIGRNLLKEKHTDFEKAVEHATEIESDVRIWHKDKELEEATVYNVEATTVRAKCYNCGEMGPKPKKRPNPTPLTDKLCYSGGRKGAPESQLQPET